MFPGMEGLLGPVKAEAEKAAARSAEQHKESVRLLEQIRDLLKDLVAALK